MTFALPCILLFAGCNQPQNGDDTPAETGEGSDASVYTRYAPAKIDILPLTAIDSSGDSPGRAEIHAYVSLLDTFNCQTKAPGTFRFELYEHVQRSAEPKGKRFVIWPDFELVAPAENNQHWHDFLRTYSFDLDFEPQGDKAYVLQATFLTLRGKRLADEIILKSHE
jgi:hypothetical protein